MFIRQYLYPQNNEAVGSAISYINSHIKETPFQVDEKIVKVARELFQENLRKNQLVSNFALLFGKAGVLGIATVLILPCPVNLCIAVISAVSIKVFFALRNAEGYRLQAALDSETEEERIRQLSLGANIYQDVWPGGSAGSEWGTIHKVSARTLSEYFADKGQREALAYILMLEENSEKRTKLATIAIPCSENVETAQLLIDFGAKPKEHENPLFASTVLGRKEVTKFLVEHGAKKC